ncbi:MAG: hypothetical protein A2161_06835 [Candidatus Schekmanbacteria bacterium RBG_13_48_7]|uniref:Addiction module antitoxin n=1 Tax=Candidatus Schekmanbacteria bacterium RBG_13_48_7 TaxID=1817878 RepID=A0A1F7RLQ9_9BACT|nr:MAG: hypothetical protein A2161_06835 [Candidatus Schekmanbacteria bacterium RBG_13_48_7]
MARYEIRIKPSAVKELENLGTKKIRQKIVKCIQNLGKNPFSVGSRKLSGYDKYRVRIGDYRILYTVEAARLIVHLIKISHRKDVYR